MLCSILISNYNKSKYVERCLNSLNEQTYKNIEIIFSDNNSTDNSIEIASKFKNIKIIKTQRISNFPAINQIDAIDNAFLHSKGEFIFLLDSDDFFEKEKISKVINFHKTYKEDFIRDIPSLYYNKKKIKKFDIRNNINYFRTWPIIFPTSTLSFTKKFYLNFKNFLHSNNFKKLEIDFRLNVYANVNKKISQLNDRLTFYNQTQDGIMSSYKKFDKNWWERRMQGHQYLQKIMSQKNLKHKRNLDYLCTCFVNIINQKIKY
tara:strand:+ start:9856 stop:10641 length:786 start_codon:yes stop_codon:yes gene_type:complete